MPYTGIDDARDAASTIIDIGFVWFSTSASGHSRSMSARISSHAGIVRNALNRPPGPIVSPMHWSTP